MQNKFENKNKYIIFQENLNVQKETLKQLEDLNRLIPTHHLADNSNSPKPQSSQVASERNFTKPSKSQ